MKSPQNRGPSSRGSGGGTGRSPAASKAGASPGGRITSAAPRRAVLCNTGEELRLRYATLPTLLDEDHVARRKTWSIADIPVDAIPDEPPVIAVEWSADSHEVLP